MDSLFSSPFHLPCRVASSVRGKDGGIASWPISLNIGICSNWLPLLPFFLSFLVLIGIRRSKHAGPISLQVNFPHRRFYSSLLVTLPILPFCSSPLSRLLCGSKENLPGFPTLCDWLGVFFQQLPDTEKNLFVYLRWLLPVKQQKMMLRKELSYLLERHQVHTKMFFTKYFRPRSY